jgi:hypothetical protein
VDVVTSVEITCSGWHVMGVDPVPGPSYWDTGTIGCSARYGLSAENYVGSEICALVADATSASYVVKLYTDGSNETFAVSMLSCDPGPYVSGYGDDTMAYLSLP